MGDPFEQYVARLLYYPPCPGHYYSADENTEERVYRVPARIVYDDGADDDAHRGRRVAHDMEKGALYVQVSLRVMVEPDGNGEVHHKADDGNYHHPDALDRLRV